MKYVKDLMTTDVKTAHTGQKLSEVSQMLREGGFHHVPVLSGNKPVGLITATDLYRLVFDIDSTDQRMLDAILDAQYNVEEVMSKDIKTIGGSEKIKEAANMLSTGDLHSLIVVDDSGEMVGILTSTDLIRFIGETL